MITSLVAICYNHFVFGRLIVNPIADHLVVLEQTMFDCLNVQQSFLMGFLHLHLFSPIFHTTHTICDTICVL